MIFTKGENTPQFKWVAACTAVWTHLKSSDFHVSNSEKRQIDLQTPEIFKQTFCDPVPAFLCITCQLLCMIWNLRNKFWNSANTHTHARRTHTHTHSQCFQPKIKVEGGRQESRWLYLYYILTIGSQDLFRQKIGRYNDSFMVIHWEMKQVWKYLRITDHNQSNPQAGFTKPLDESTNTHQNWCLILLFLTFVHTAS